MSRSYNSRRGSKNGHLRKDDWVVMGKCHKHLRHLPAPDEEEDHPLAQLCLRKKEYRGWILRGTL